MRPGRNHHDRAHRLIVHDFGRTQPPTATRRFRRAYAQPTATSRPYDAMMAWAGADGWVGSPHPLVVRRSFRRAYPSAMRVGVSASPTEQVMVRRTLRRGDGRVVRMVVERGECVWVCGESVMRALTTEKPSPLLDKFRASSEPLTTESLDSCTQLISRTFGNGSLISLADLGAQPVGKRGAFLVSAHGHGTIPLAAAQGGVHASMCPSHALSSSLPALWSSRGSGQLHH
jgi:hypothetical protein